MNCLQFYELLKGYYPQAVAYHDSDHVIVEIDGQFFDKDGEVEKGSHLPIEGTEWKVYEELRFKPGDSALNFLEGDDEEWV